MKNYIPCIGLWSTIMFMFLTACSSKISNPKIDKLAMQQEVLKKNTELNGLKLELEKETGRNRELISDVEEVNSDAAVSANESKDRLERLSGNPGDTGLSRKASKSAGNAADNARKARKMNSALDKSTARIKKLERKIEDLEKEVSELNAKIEFIPNQQN
jgi:predicted  nucleic acid-binding Zn-ribbon protein